MRANLVPFTGSGTINNGGPVSIAGLAFTGFTSVVVHHGNSTAGDVVANVTAPGTNGWNFEILCPNGIYLECAGTGKGTVWVC